MPDYLYAVGSALLWAVSVPVVSAGIRSPACGDHRAQVLAGLMLSMLSGITVLSFFVLWLGESIRFSTDLALAGIFTFPLATGIYYFTGVAFDGRADFAALFSKVKPLLSVALAVVVLGESLDMGMTSSLTLISAGILLLLLSSGFKQIDIQGVLLGLLTATFWAVGEYFMKTGISGTHPIAANLSALLIGTGIFLPFALAPMKKALSASGGMVSLSPFLLHGFLSFGLAYSLFFLSLDQIGLGRTVLINAFWPVLGILLTVLLRLFRGLPPGLPVLVIIAAVMLTAGSLLQALFLINAG